MRIGGFQRVSCRSINEGWEEIWRGVWRQRASVALIMAVCIAAAAIYLLRIPPTYSVRSTLYIERRLQDGKGDRDQEYLQTQAAVLSSTGVLKQAVENADVRRLPELGRAKHPAAYLRSRLSIDATKRGGLLVLTLECSDAAGGASLLNALIQAYVDHQGQEGLLPPAANVGIVEPPDEGSASVRPRWFATLGLAGILGSALGMAWALGRTWFDSRLHSLGAIGEMVDVPIVGSVPLLWPAPKIDWLGNGIIEQSGECRAVFRLLGTSLLPGNGHKPARTILITSATEGEGKTVVATGLAAALAGAGERVLLMQLGTADAQESAADMARRAPATDTIVQTDFSGLDVYRWGSAHSRLGPGVTAAGLREMLEELSSTYDRIVIDGPAVLAFAEGRMAATTCEATLLVLRVGRITAADCTEAVAVLRGVGATLAGVIANGTSARRRGRARPAQAPMDNPPSTAVRPMADMASRAGS